MVTTFLYCLPFRARSIYERALDVDHRNITIWLKYAEMEMKWVCLFDDFSSTN